MATGIDLKNEDEVQEYLERLGIEYRFGCYYEKDGKGNFQDNILVLPFVGVILAFPYSIYCNSVIFLSTYSL